MRNEMGNQNASGIKAEEEKAATEDLEKPQEAAHEDVVKEENHRIPEVQTTDIHEKAAELSSDDFSVTKDSNAERYDSDEKEKGNKESEPSSRYPQAASDSNHSVSQDNYVEKVDSPYEANCEKPLESKLEEIMPINDKIQNNDQPSARRETDAGKDKHSNSSSESITFQDSKSIDVVTTHLEEHQGLSSEESEEVLKMSMSCQKEEKQDNQNEINKESNSYDLVLKDIEDKSPETNMRIDQCHRKGIEEEVQHGQGNDGDTQLPLRENLNAVSISATEAVPEVSPIDPSSESLEPQQKHIIHAEEISLTNAISENPEDEPDLVQAQIPEQKVDQLIGNDTLPMIEHEPCSKENGEENLVKMISSSDSEKVYQTEGTEMIPTATEHEQEQLRDKIVVAVMLETFPVSNGLTSIDGYDEATNAANKLLAEEMENRNDSSSTRNNKDNTGTVEEVVSSFQSIEEQNCLVPGSPIPPFNLGNGFSADSSTPSFNHQWDNGLCSEAAEGRNNFSVNLKEYSSCDSFIADVSTFNAQNASIQIPNRCSALEMINHVQSKSGTEADHKMGETSPLPSIKTQESVNIESDPDHPVTRVKLRKSPSFEFGIPLDARSEESDQTPLLVRDKSLARSFSGQANVRFSNTMMATDYGRKSLDYEPLAVEEKTIRMERSDSNVSRDSFMSLLVKDIKQSVEIASEKKESHVAEKKALESKSEELALTSVKNSGKRKPRSSLFSACICCTAAIH